jgi:hypothetical protein
MGIGPNGSSLLAKLGSKAAWEMTEGELIKLVQSEQERRSKARALGRVVRATKGKTPQVKITKLEQLGIAPEICVRLRASGVEELELIKKIRAAGIL